MALITLLSASGAPGVTTTALALALTWPRQALLVEADPAGTSAVLAGYLQGSAEHSRSVVQLGIAHRRGMLQQSLPDVMMDIPDTSVKFIPGLQMPSQRTTTAALWEPLATAFHGLETAGIDVIIDAGRLGMNGHPTPLVTASDLVLLVTRSTLPAVAAAKVWSEELAKLLEEHGSPRSLGLAIIGPGQPYRAGQISAALNGLPVLASLAFDPVAAEVFSLGAEPRRGFAHAPLVRSTKAAVEAIYQRLHPNQTPAEDATDD